MQYDDAVNVHDQNLFPTKLIIALITVNSSYILTQLVTHALVSFYQVISTQVLIISN